MDQPLEGSPDRGEHVRPVRQPAQRGQEHQALAPEQLRASLFQGSRAGGLGLLHDLQDLSLLANSVRTQYTILHQGALELRDSGLETTVNTLGDQTNRQIDWLCGRIKQHAPQVLVAHIENGKIAEVWNTIAGDEAPWNEFWK